MCKNCISCLRAVGKAATDGHKKWNCGINGFAVNARMCCEEWTGRTAMAMRDNPVSKQSHLMM